MPDLIHECGAKLSFPPGMEGRKGRCPTCGLAVHIPGSSGAVPKQPKASPSGATPAPPKSGVMAAARSGAVPQAPAKPAGPTGRCPSWRGDTSISLDPPANWDSYVEYLEGHTPAPMNAVIPANIMLKDDAEAKWQAGLEKPPPSKFHCPGCKKRLDVGQRVCTGCGIDLVKGRTLDGKSKLTPEADAYLSKIPWIVEAREGGGEDEEPEKGDKPKPRFPGLGKRPGRS